MVWLGVSHIHNTSTVINFTENQLAVFHIMNVRVNSKIKFY